MRFLEGTSRSSVCEAWGRAAHGAPGHDARAENPRCIVLGIRMVCSIPSGARDACVLRHRPYSEGPSGATKVWRRPGLATFEIEDCGELDAGGDAEFGEDFVHVVFDGACADVELRGDLGVRF